MFPTLKTLTDSHCHLYFDVYNEDQDDVITQAWNAGVERMLVPGIDLPTSEAALKLAGEKMGVYAAAGIHPNNVHGWDDNTLEKLEKLVANPKIVAIGEIGLDYYWDRTPQDLQHEIFRAQLDLAKRMNLPVVIHTRNKQEQDRQCMLDMMMILKEFDTTIQGVLHSFSGNLRELKRALDLDFYIGISGPVTFKNAHGLRSIVSTLPLDRLLIETDSPFLSPHPYRGKRNQPSYIAIIAGKIAEIFDRAASEIAEITSANARKLFRWS